MQEYVSSVMEIHEAEDMLFNASQFELLFHSLLGGKYALMWEFETMQCSQ